MQNYVINNMKTVINQWLNDNVNPIGSTVAVDKSFSVPGMSPDSALTGDRLNKIEDIILPITFPDWDITKNGIKSVKKGNFITNKGIATETSLYILFNSSNSFPEGLIPGKKYWFELEAKKMYMQIFYYDTINGTQKTLCYSYSSCYLTIPENATGIYIRLNIPSNSEVDEIVYFAIHKDIPISTLQSIGAKEYRLNSKYNKLFNIYSKFITGYKNKPNYDYNGVVYCITSEIMEPVNEPLYLQIDQGVQCCLSLFDNNSYNSSAYFSWEEKSIIIPPNFYFLIELEYTDQRIIYNTLDLALSIYAPTKFALHLNENDDFNYMVKNFARTGRVGTELPIQDLTAKNFGVTMASRGVSWFLPTKDLTIQTSKIDFKVGIYNGQGMLEFSDSWIRKYTFKANVIYHIWFALASNHDADLGDLSQYKDDFKEISNNNYKLSDMVLSNNIDLLDNSDIQRIDYEHPDLKWDWLTDGSCHITGTLGTQTRFRDLYKGALPSWLSLGKTYYIKYKGEHIRFMIYIKRDAASDDNDYKQILDTRTNDKLILPLQIHSIIIRLSIWADEGEGTIVNEIVKPQMFLEPLDNFVKKDFKTLINGEFSYQDYFQPEIEDTVKKIKKAITEPCLSFLWCSDIHYQASVTGTLMSDSITWTAASMRELAKRIRFDGLLCTGDAIDAKPPLTREATEKQIDYVMEKLKSVNLPIIYALGNHDDCRYYGVNDNQTLNPFSKEELYSKFISYVTPKNIPDLNANGLNYYIDYDKFKIRIIVLNSNYWTSTNWEYGFSDETVQYFQTQLDAIPSNYSVIMITHQSPIKEHNPDNSNYNNFTNITNLISSFIQKGGRYICTLYGHGHLDFAATSPWLEITTCCVKASTNQTDVKIQAPNVPEGGIARARKAGTITEQCYDILIIKPISKKIELIRFGAGSDRSFTY